MTTPLLLSSLLLSCGLREDIQTISGLLDPEVPEAESVLSVAPSDGAMALRGALDVQISLPESDRGLLPAVTIADGDGEILDAECAMSGPDRALCAGPDELPYDADYTISVDLQTGDPVDLAVTTRTPEPGRAFRLNESVAVSWFGADPDAVATLQLVFSANDMVGVFDGYADRAGDVLFVAGPADFSDNSSAMVEAPGLTFVLPVIVETDRDVISAPADAFFPLSVEGVLMHALIQDAQLEGALSDQGLTWALRGTFPGATLSELAASLGSTGELLLGVIEYDVDTDEDGEPDAASFELTGASADVDLQAWNMGI